MAKIKSNHVGPIHKSNFVKRNKLARNDDKDAKYLAWLHKLECCVTGISSEDLEAHHIRVGLYSGGMKSPDKYAVPVIKEYHRVEYPNGLHNGERAFWNKHGVDPIMLAEELYRAFKAGSYPNTGVELIRAHLILADIRNANQIDVA